jgi:methionyl-tRNA synthetase
MAKKNKYYITTPIYYPNAKPHVGTLYSTLIADVSARFHKLMGQEVFFLTGTDEHGQKLQEKAEELKMAPKDFIDSIIPDFKKVWSLFDIQYDKFIRTTDTEHEAAVAQWIMKLQEQGDIYKSAYTGLYCVPCEMFINVNSETPKNDQGVYICQTHNRVLSEIEEESYFFRLSAYQDQLLELYEKHPDFIVPKERMAEVVSFVKSGLRDLSISRKTVSWGIPFPGDPSHTVYVWGDALNNYISGVGYGQSSPEALKNFEHWWPADVHVMAKDIVRFHAVYWPAFLMAANLPLPKKLLVHGYILMGENKMSKSLGNAISPENLAEWYGVEQVRYYLMRHMAITHDGQFDVKDLEDCISADLANNLSNLVHRMLSLAGNNGMSNVAAPAAWEATASLLRDKCEESYLLYWDEMSRGYFHVALAQVRTFISEVNAYFQNNQPWVLAKKNPELFAEVVAATCNSLYAIGLMLIPVMPKKMESLLQLIGHSYDPSKNYDDVLRRNDWSKSFTLAKATDPLFVRPESRLPKDDEPAEKQTTKPKPALKTETASAQTDTISIDDFAKCQLIVGTIMSCEEVAGSDKLYKMQVDCGIHGMRQIFSGVKKNFKPEDLVGKQGVVVANLPPRKMPGGFSEGMLLYASDTQGNHRLASVSAPVENGTQLK